MSALSKVFAGDSPRVMLPNARFSSVKMDVRISTESVRILIADFDVLFRSSLRALLNERDGYLVLGEAKDKTSLLTMVRELKPNLLLLSWELSQHDDMAVLRELVDCEDSPRIVLFSFPSNSIDVAPAIRNGVVGILSKEATAESLFDAIEKVNQGQYFLGQAGLASLVESATNRNPKTGFQKARRMFGITRREFDIIPEVVAGYSTVEIAERLSMSCNTLKHHMSHIYDKCGVSNRLELVLFVLNHDLVPNER